MRQHTDRRSIQTHRDNTETIDNVGSGVNLMFSTESKIPDLLHYPLPYNPDICSIGHRGAVHWCPPAAQFGSVRFSSTRCILLSRRNVRRRTTTSVCPVHSTACRQWATQRRRVKHITSWYATVACTDTDNTLYYCQPARRPRGFQTPV